MYLFLTITFLSKDSNDLIFKPCRFSLVWQVKEDQVRPTSSQSGSLLLWPPGTLRQLLQALPTPTGKIYLFIRGGDLHLFN
jgi:hypothetical protein